MPPPSSSTNQGFTPASCKEPPESRGQLGPAASSSPEKHRYRSFWGTCPIEISCSAASIAAARVHLVSMVPRPRTIAFQNGARKGRMNPFFIGCRHYIIMAHQYAGPLPAFPRPVVDNALAAYDHTLTGAPYFGVKRVQPLLKGDKLCLIPPLCHP